MNEKRMTYGELVLYTERIIHYATRKLSRLYDIQTIYDAIDENVQKQIDEAIDEREEEIRAGLRKELRKIGGF